jgi:DNA-binding GntR family transcriptional regulator
MTLSEYIEQDLRAQILARSAPPRMTLRELADRYRVSFTPIRRAVDVLVRERLVRKLENRRLEVLPPPPGRKAAAVSAPPDWHRRIARDILRRSLRGETGYLREEQTARELGIGRTLLRQVFSRLVGAGLLEHVPRRGWQVRPFRKEELSAYLDVREVLELKALDLARPRLVRADLERILAENRPCGSGAWQVDTELHPYLVEKAGNRYLRDFFGRHGAYYTTLFYTATLGVSVVEEMARQHRAILEALLRRKWGAARALLARHIRAQEPVLLRLMKRLAGLPAGNWPELAPLEGSPGYVTGR